MDGVQSNHQNSIPFIRYIIAVRIDASFTGGRGIFTEIPHEHLTGITQYPN